MSISSKSGMMNKDSKDGDDTLKIGASKSSKFNGAPCAYFDGVYQYFTTHITEFHAE